MGRNTKTGRAARAWEALNAAFPFQLLEQLERRRLFAVALPTIATGAAANLSQGLLFGPNHSAESVTAIDPANPDLAVTVFTAENGFGRDVILSYCDDYKNPNPTWVSKELDSLAGVHDAETQDNPSLLAHSWLNVQCAFDASGTLFIAADNDGPLAILRNRDYNPNANSGLGTTFEVYRTDLVSIDRK